MTSTDDTNPTVTSHDAIFNTDWSLVNSVREYGEDEERYSAFVADCCAGLHVYAERYLGIDDRDFREEVAQSFVAEYFATRKIFLAADETRGSFESLLKTTFINHVRKQYRKAKQRREMPSGSITLEGLETVMKADRFELEWAAEILKLSREHMQANKAVLEVWDARSGVRGEVEPVGSIAERLSITARTVNRHFKRARKLHEKAIAELLVSQLGSGKEEAKEALKDLWRILAG